MKTIFTQKQIDYIIEEYNKGMSRSYLQNTLNISHKVIYRILKENCIPQRTLQEAVKLPHRLELSKQTSLEKYGSEFHTNKDSKIYEKIKESTFIKYGVENVFQLDSTKEKCKETMIKNFGDDYNKVLYEKRKTIIFEKYSVDNVYKIPKVIKEIQAKKFKNKKSFTKSSIIADDLFDKIYVHLSEEDKNHCYYNRLNKEFGKYGNDRYNYYDFVLTNKKLCFEFYGDYWHMNPIKYQSTDINSHLKITAEEIWNKDLLKRKILEDLGFKVIVIWEKDLNTNLNLITELLQCI